MSRCRGRELLLLLRCRSTTILHNQLKPVKIISASTSPRPEIVVDFDVEDGLLTVSLKNVGGSSAYLVRTSFDKPFHGLGGE